MARTSLAKRDPILDTRNVSPSSQVARGRVLVIGGRTARERGVLRRLSNSGFSCATASDAPSLERAVQELHPEAILFTGAKHASSTLPLIEGDATLRSLPRLADVSGADAKVLRGLPFDEFVSSKDELTSRIAAALTARRLVERDVLRTRRMEMLLDITQAATSSLELGEILRIAVEKIAQVVATDRCSVVLVEGNSPRAASVVATLEKPEMAPMELDLAKYPELRRALETRQATYVEDASRDALMDEVRPSIGQLGGSSILVQPLICQDDLMGALFLRMARTEGGFARDDQEFAQAVAGALANSIRNARMHAGLQRRRDDLESAYVDRYRELTEANRRLKELNRLKDELIAMCSHDLRAPLQVLLGHARLLLETELSLEQTQSAETVVRQAKKILNLVESLLDRGKGEQVRVSLEARLLDVAKISRETTHELEILAQEKRLLLRAEGDVPLIAIADELKLREVLQNLITNAIAHARDRGRVTVRAERLVRPDGEVARVVVQDDGAGLADDQLHLVFDRYRHGPGGTGLGLAICKDFVELHGGEIWAESPAEGGAAFVFTIPLAKNAKLRPPLPDGETARVLVVEDDPTIAAALEEILRSRYRVEVARDGAEGLAKARALQPDLVIMDVFLPRMDGLDAVVALKASSDTAEIPVILVSAQQGVADKVKALNLGAVDYLSKPFLALELLSRTERALTLRRTERELRRSQSLLKRTGRDPETGLHDRSGLVVRLNQEASRSRRYGRPFSIAVLSVGPVPPDALRVFGTHLRERLRAPDVVAHLGGGVFAVMLPECSAESGARVFARLQPVLEEAAGLKAQVKIQDVPEGEMPDAVLELMARAY